MVLPDSATPPPPTQTIMASMTTTAGSAESTMKTKVKAMTKIRGETIQNAASILQNGAAFMGTLTNDSGAEIVDVTTNIKAAIDGDNNKSDDDSSDAVKDDSEEENVRNKGMWDILDDSSEHDESIFDDAGVLLSPVLYKKLTSVSSASDDDDVEDDHDSDDNDGDSGSGSSRNSSDGNNKNSRNDDTNENTKRVANTNTNINTKSNNDSSKGNSSNASGGENDDDDNGSENDDDSSSNNSTSDTVVVSVESSNSESGQEVWGSAADALSRTLDVSEDSCDSIVIPEERCLTHTNDNGVENGNGNDNNTFSLSFIAVSVGANNTKTNDDKNGDHNNNRDNFCIATIRCQDAPKNNHDKTTVAPDREATIVPTTTPSAITGTGDDTTAAIPSPIPATKPASDAIAIAAEATADIVGTISRQIVKDGAANHACRCCKECVEADTADQSFWSVLRETAKAVSEEKRRALEEQIKAASPERKHSLPILGDITPGFASSRAVWITRWSPPFGGGEAAFLEMMRRVSRLGMHVDWLAFTTPSNQPHPRLRVDRVDGAPGCRVLHVPGGYSEDAIVAWLKLLRPAWAHQQGSGKRECLLACQRVGVPLVAAYHFWHEAVLLHGGNSHVVQNVDRHRVDPLLSQMIESCALVYVASEFMRDVIHRISGYDIAAVVHPSGDDDVARVPLSRCLCFKEDPAHRHDHDREHNYNNNGDDHNDDSSNGNNNTNDVSAAAAVVTNAATAYGEGTDITAELSMPIADEDSWISLAPARAVMHYHGLPNDRTGPLVDIAKREFNPRCNSGRETVPKQHRTLRSLACEMKVPMADRGSDKSSLKEPPWDCGPRNEEGGRVRLFEGVRTSTNDARALDENNNNDDNNGNDDNSFSGTESLSHRAQGLNRSPSITGSDWFARCFRDPWERPFVTMINVHELKGGRILLQLINALPSVAFLGIRTESMSDGLDAMIREACCQRRVAHSRGEKGVAPSWFCEHRIDDVRRVYALSRVILVPSVVDETFCRVALEAMQNGIPVITTGAGNITNVVGPAAVVIPLGPDTSSKDWVDALSGIVPTEPTRQKSHALDARIRLRYRSLQKLGLKRSLSLYGSLSAQAQTTTVLSAAARAIRVYHTTMIIAPWCDQGLGVQARDLCALLERAGIRTCVFSFAPYWVPRPGIDDARACQADPSEWSHHPRVYYSIRDREGILDAELVEFVYMHSVTSCIIPETCWPRIFQVARLMTDIGVKACAIPNVEIVRRDEIHKHRYFSRILTPNEVCARAFESYGFSPVRIGYSVSGIDFGKPQYGRALTETTHDAANNDADADDDDDNDWLTHRSSATKSTYATTPQIPLSQPQPPPLPTSAPSITEITASHESTSARAYARPYNPSSSARARVHDEPESLLPRPYSSSPPPPPSSLVTETPSTMPLPPISTLWAQRPRSMGSRSVVRAVCLGGLNAFTRKRVPEVMRAFAIAKKSRQEELTSSTAKAFTFIRKDKGDPFIHVRNSAAPNPAPAFDVARSNAAVTGSFDSNRYNTPRSALPRDATPNHDVAADAATVSDLVIDCLDIELTVCVQGSITASQLEELQRLVMPGITLLNTHMSSREIRSLYSSHDMVVHMSRHEGIGLGFYEALAAGVPILSLDTPPHNEVVRDGINGTLVRCSHASMTDNRNGVIMSADFSVSDLAAGWLNMTRSKASFEQLLLSTWYDAAARFDPNAFAIRLSDAVCF